MEQEIIGVIGKENPDFSEVNEKVKEGWKIISIIPQVVTAYGGPYHGKFYGGFAVLMQKSITL